MNIQDAKIIDLKNSKLAIDERISEIKKQIASLKGGTKKAELAKTEKLLKETEKEKKRQVAEADYDFTDKVFISYRNKDLRPADFYTWCRYEQANSYRDLRAWKAKWGYTPVNVDDTEYVPDGVAPDESGKFVFGDLILVKCPLIEHLKRRAMEIGMSEGGAKRRMKKFHNDMKKAGSPIPEKEMEDMLGALI